MAINTAAKKRTFVNALLKKLKDDVVAAVDKMPAEWDEAELTTYLKSKLHNPKHEHELRGNTVRGREYARALEWTKGL